MDRAKPELYDICPGLFRMKLNLMYTSGQTQVENRTMALDTAIEREHAIVHGVVDLMRTLLNNPLRKHRYIARNTKKLEQNIKNNPKHLNTLADLADLYRSNNLKEKAKIIEDKIGKTLQSSDSDDIKEKAICIVEQGYAVLFEESKENELEAQQRLADSFELIKAEKNSSIEKRKDLLSLALKYTVNAQRLLCLAINCKSDDTIAEEKKSSIEMFQKGIQYLRNTSYSMENMYVWTYYYAMACNRMPYNDNDIGIQAVYLFWSVISNLPKDDERFSIYRARSYAYIGHKIITRNEAFNASLSTSSLTSDAQFLALLKAPLSAFELAIAELPYDEVILNRKGISLWSLFKFGSAKTDDEKLHYLEQAEETLSLSISQNPRMHLLAFSTRMKVYMDLSTLKVFSEERRKAFLHKAMHDGKHSIKYNMSPRDVCTVADVCQKLAKFPNFYRYGPDAVSNSEYLNEALDYLNQCISAKGQTYFTAFAIGKVYFDLAEYRLATEWLKRAFMFSDQTRGFENVKLLCISVLKLGDTSCINSELIHVLTFIANRMNDLEFLKNLVPKGLWNDYLGKLWEFIKFLETFHLTADQVRIAEYLKNILVKKDFLTARRLRICQFQPSNRYGLEYDLNATSLLRADIGYAGVSQNCRYDYFIIVNEANSGWIQCFLQHELGIQMIDDDITLTGWPGAIDYDSCSSLLETTIEGIKECRKSILVLSKYFLKREWCVLKTIITQTLKRRSDFLRIILLENCDIPPEIDCKRLWFFDFTHDQNIPIEIQHLKLALLEN